MKKIIGIDLGGTSVKIAIISLSGDILEKWSIPTNGLDNGNNIVSDIIHSIQEHFELLQLSEKDFLGIGMGSPGKVNPVEKTVVGAYNLGWSRLQQIGKVFENIFPLPFFIGNDANVAALGEQWRGAGKGERDVVMFTLGTGVGGGIVANGQLVTGFGGAAGEIGHLKVDTEQRFTCTCGGKGCLETVASATGIVNLARYFSKEYEDVSSIKKAVDDGNDITSKEIFNSAQKGDVLANTIVDQFAGYLGLALSHVANTLSPSHIVIGGGVSAAGEFLRQKIAEKTYENIFPQIRDRCQISLAELGNDAGVIGASKLVLLGVKNN